MTESHRRIEACAYFSGSQLQHLQLRLLRDALQRICAQIDDTVEVITADDIRSDAPVVICQSFCGSDHIFQFYGDLIDLIQVEAQHRCQHHVGEAAGHRKALVMCLRRQVDGIRIVSGLSRLGQRAFTVASHEQMINVLSANFIGYIDRADRFRRVSGTSERNKQSRTVLRQIVFRRSHDIRGRIGLYLESVGLVQIRIQCVSDIFAGACASQNDVIIFL